MPRAPGEVATAANRRDQAPGSNGRPEGVYINQAARIVGVSASLIRIWENEGLLTPLRTPSGYRVFSPQDIERLRHVRDLIQRDGLNAAGVRRLLTSGGVRNGAERNRPQLTGERVRMFRRRRGLSLRAVAALTGLSPSAISAVERGLS